MNQNTNIGIGGSMPEEVLSTLKPNSQEPQPIQKEEFQERLKKACSALKEQDLDALYLNAGTNLYYFTETHWSPSERLVGALLFADGSLKYIVPEFEIGTFEDFMGIEGDIISWKEHESPIEVIANHLSNNIKLAVDDSTRFTLVSKFQENKRFEISSAENLIRDIRMIKSKAEIEHLQYAMDLTMQVHKAAAKILKPGITPQEVEEFIHHAHQKLGVESGSYFCIVLFGKDSSFPHGVKSPKALEENDMVLIDTGTRYKSYISDITRTYIYGKASDKEIDIWNKEKSAQLAAFEAAQLGKPCSHIDEQVRVQLEKDGLGPAYELPGLPHRTGHGIGIEIHEHPFIVGGNNIPLQRTALIILSDMM